MRKLIVVASALLIFFLAVNVFGQGTSLGGIVTDSSEAVIPGATITATNDDTGVVSSAFSNDSGAYNFPSLTNGIYTVKTELEGFQTATFTDVSLNVGQQARLNFELEVAGVATTVEVTTSARELLLESGSSVGDILLSETIMDLPQVGRNALDLVRLMSGVVVSDGTVYGRTDTTFAGVSATGVNIQRDGMTVNDVRFPTGINAATRVNPDMVGEFKMILAPVDAEQGRGNAQVQIATKGGGNAYHGNAVWNIQNTALDPNTWNNNRLGNVPDWRNMQEISVSVGGPIVKNKTFFFALFDYQVANERDTHNAMSMTPCARNGVFRFFDRWNNDDWDYTGAQNSSLGSNPTINTVDVDGNPLTPQWEPGFVLDSEGARTSTQNWGLTAYTGQLRYTSIFGAITNIDSLNADCSNAVIDGEGWDSVRTGMDPSGFIADFMEKLPMPNNYEIGDGLNTAGFKWTRPVKGMENLFGVGEDTYRKQINIRIDHNFSDKHRINGSWSFERDHADDTLRTWPENSWSGGGKRQPQVLSLNFQSSFRPTLLNEIKVGMSRTGSNILGPASRPSNGTAMQDYLAEFGTLADGQVGVIEPGNAPAQWWLPSTDYYSFRTDGPGGTASTPYGTRGLWAIGDMVDNSPRYTIGDTLTWVKGTHSIRVGGEYRRATSDKLDQWIITPSFQWGLSNPEYQGGEAPNTPNSFDLIPDAWNADPDVFDRPDSLQGSASNSGNKLNLKDMLSFMSGSLASVKQVRYVNEIASDGDFMWNDPLTDPRQRRLTLTQEFSMFVKDDWKIRPDLTLNLGVRWDYYGIPWIGNGMTVGLEGGGNSLYGPTGSSANWFQPISQGDTAPGEAVISLRSIGPGGRFSSEGLYKKRYKNFGPAVGFAYELPWFGKGKTTLRGGYQLSYLAFNNNFGDIQSAGSQSPGFLYINNWSPDDDWVEANGYFGIKDLDDSLFSNGIPLPDTAIPGLTEFPQYDRTQSATAFSPNYRSPYVQTLTLSVTRNVTSNLTVDLRYIGTLTRHNFSSKNINTPNFLSNGLLAAFNSARAGGDPALLDDLLDGVTLGFNQCGDFFGIAVDGIDCKGGEAVRTATFAAGIPSGLPGYFGNPMQLLASGNYQGLVGLIGSSNSGWGQPTGKFLEDNGFPANFLRASPELNTATIFDNQASANYHSFQSQITLRPTSGLYFQGTYTWSKNLGNSGGVSPDPRDIGTGYVLQSMDRTHNMVTYGNWDLPFGPGQLVGGDTHGAIGKVIGGWQIGWIANVTSGAPLNIGAYDGLYGNSRPDAVNGGIDLDSMSFNWGEGDRYGHHFEGGDRFTTRRDPQCDNDSIVHPSLQSQCNFNALVDTTTDQIVLQNSLPGMSGNLPFRAFRDLTRWNVDMSLSKGVLIREGVDFRFRVDIENILNHARPGSPTMSISSNIGRVSSKSGGRTVQAMMRIDF